MLKHAFKEWAVICKALAEGKQAIILRKGGIAEEGGVFKAEHGRFWLYPTWLHQEKSGLKHGAASLLHEVEKDRPPAGTIRLTHFVQVPGVYHTTDLQAALLVASLHMWSEETIEARFHYKKPGLYVLPARVFRVPKPIELAESPKYAGCKSWVELDEAFSTDGAVPVLDEAKFRDVMRKLDAVLNPVALA